MSKSAMRKTLRFKKITTKLDIVIHKKLCATLCNFVVQKNNHQVRHSHT
jgi:hypothetical protein